MDPIGSFTERHRRRLEEWHEACGGCGQRYQGIGPRCGSCEGARRECAELLAQRRAILEDTSIARAMLPPWDSWATFKDLVVHPGIDRRVYKAARAWKRRAGNLLMLGPTGVGKTACAHAIARRILTTALNANELDDNDRSFACSLRWYAASKLALARRQTPLGEGEARAVEDAGDASLLVIDELGFEAVLDGTLFDVVNARYERRVPTIVTSGRREESLAERYGDAFLRRLRELGTVVDVHPQATQ
jgi:DNA replication protein DnaC